jgi:hypothetical protein
MFWLGLGIVMIWIAIAFWPARVARRKGHSFLGYFILGVFFFPLADPRVRRGGPKRVRGALRPALLGSDRVGSLTNAYNVSAMTMSEPSRAPAGKRDDEGDLTRLRARPSRETGCSEAEAGFAVHLALERFRGARIQEFVTLLAERDARRQLRALASEPVSSIEPEARGGGGSTARAKNSAKSGRAGLAAFERVSGAARTGAGHVRHD